MWLPFINKINKLKKERNELQNIICEMIRSVQDILKEHGKFILNGIGSGDNTYTINGRLFEFNEFSCKHCGFFIDNKKVSLKQFIKDAQKCDRRKKQL